jgi:hypothetical protein
MVDDEELWRHDHFLNIDVWCRPAAVEDMPNNYWWIQGIIIDQMY